MPSMDVQLSWKNLELALHKTHKLKLRTKTSISFRPSLYPFVLTLTKEQAIKIDPKAAAIFVVENSINHFIYANIHYRMSKYAEQKHLETLNLYFTTEENAVLFKLLFC